MHCSLVPSPAGGCSPAAVLASRPSGAGAGAALTRRSDFGGRDACPIEMWLRHIARSISEVPHCTARALMARVKTQRRSPFVARLESSKEQGIDNQSARAYVRMACDSRPFVTESLKIPVFRTDKIKGWRVGGQGCKNMRSVGLYMFVLQKKILKFGSGPESCSMEGIGSTFQCKGDAHLY